MRITKIDYTEMYSLFFTLKFMRNFSKSPQISHSPTCEWNGWNWATDQVTKWANAVGVVIGLSEKDEIQWKFDTWCEENSAYGWIDMIKKNVNVHEDGLHINTELWTQSLMKL